MKRLLIWLSTPVSIVVLKLAILIAALEVESEILPLGDPKNSDVA